MYEGNGPMALEALTLAAQQIMEKRGYVVVEWLPGPKPLPPAGTVIEPGQIAFHGTGLAVPVRLLSIGPTTRADYLEQWEVHRFGRPPLLYESAQYFKVIAE